MGDSLSHLDDLLMHIVALFIFLFYFEPLKLVVQVLRIRCRGE